MEIRRIQVLTCGATIDGEAFIDRTMGRRIRIWNNRYYWIAPERRDRAVLTGKDKPRSTRSGAVVYDKAIAAIKDEAGRIPLLASHSWNDKEGRGVGTNVEERCLASAVVGDPPRRCGTRVQSPGVDYVRIQVVC